MDVLAKKELSINARENVTRQIVPTFLVKPQPTPNDVTSTAASHNKAEPGVWCCYNVRFSPVVDTVVVSAKQYSLISETDPIFPVFPTYSPGGKNVRSI